MQSINIALGDDGFRRGTYAALREDSCAIDLRMREAVDREFNVGTITELEYLYELGTAAAGSVTRGRLERALNHAIN